MLLAHVAANCRPFCPHCCIAVLQATGLDQQLQAPTDPAYTGPVLPEQQYQIDLPWWFAGAQGAAAAAAPPPPAPAPVAPPPAGVPAAGPYTVSTGIRLGVI